MDHLIERYSPMLTGLCMHLCQNRADAEDLFQDTWERVMKESKKRNLRDIAYAQAWIARICINLYIDRARKRSREAQAEFQSNEEKDAFLQNVSDPSARAEYGELYDALERLDPEHKSVIVLKYFYGYPDSQIAAILNIPEGTVRSRLHMGKLKLRSDLCDEPSDR
ncbi:MAG: sigma-70 family RNA polymerase sigma factor [Clostridia bacterium]|nr:sigma-70 family RNA polymerase sigma factor [Clostridia bacterium]